MYLKILHFISIGIHVSVGYEKTAEKIHHLGNYVESNTFPIEQEIKTKNVDESCVQVYPYNNTVLQC